MTKLFEIGAHESTLGGFVAMEETMRAMGGNTFQYFSRNPRGSRLKENWAEGLELFLNQKGKSWHRILAHAPYTLNPASDKEHVREFARQVLKEDLENLARIPGAYYNFHPGSHMKQGSEHGIELICEILNDILTGEEENLVLLETMAGKGTEVGRTFEEIRAIMDGVEKRHVLGVCLDTCHVYDAGYDIVNDLEGVLAEFDRIIGLQHLHMIHLNDSKNPMGSHKDRHEKWGQGTLGLDTAKTLLNHPKLAHIPFLLETPNDEEGYAQEIALMKSLRCI